MNRYIYGFLYVIVVFFIPFTLNAEGSDRFMPEWKIGDTWLVNAVYHFDIEKEKWSMPVLWEYRIVESTRYDGEDCFVVAVSRKKKVDKPAARLLYRTSDHSLAFAEIIKIRRGKKSARRFVFKKGIPVQTVQGMVPFDTPVFPLYNNMSGKFEVKKAVTDGLYAVDTIKQSVTTAWGIIDESVGLKINSDLIKVECISENGSVFFKQYWDKSKPWPVYAINNNIKYWLVEN